MINLLVLWNFIKILDSGLPDLRFVADQVGSLVGEHSVNKLNYVDRGSQLLQHFDQVLVVDAIIRFLDVDPGRVQFVVVLLVQYFIHQGLLFGPLAASTCSKLTVRDNSIYLTPFRDHRRDHFTY